MRNLQYLATASLITSRALVTLRLRPSSTKQRLGRGHRGPDFSDLYRHDMFMLSREEDVLEPDVCMFCMYMIIAKVPGLTTT